jgi:hypothetical protein
VSSGIHFDWVVGDGISLTIRGGSESLATVHLTAREARLLAKRLSEWQDYKDARSESRPCRQPTNSMSVGNVTVRGKPV